MLHSGTFWGACLIPGFARTSTGRGTRRRGNPGRPGSQANRPGSPTRRFGRSSDRNGRQAGSRLQFLRRFAVGHTGEPDRDRWTAWAQVHGTPETRSATGYSRPPFQLRWNGAEAKVQTRMAKSQPGLGEGTKSTGSPGRFVPSLNSGASRIKIAGFPHVGRYAARRKAAGAGRLSLPKKKARRSGPCEVGNTAEASEPEVHNIH